ncbi:MULTISPECIES: ABC transporter ATP-binding protein [Alphaproteobacteria]|uniref:ABC transporter ATP-binding protein n=2 Tax=Alphaproteobacteria TaxID=28211 RepID=A0A512HMH4_9HYPH|nr:MULTISPECIES: ABC transporter ATP-binding protein [Alphaproteobacteria]GEO86643.1 ABC transporter ATP-binding protein [Ciceribacter naphthalenivorans]GLR23627.1 ABC transporter ATP-binding protein [Ciceribacter naphthalenivorans]GLT06483.1 ABC transporter ATP-binding protein [Sphingomonas psychrolutea]
MASVTLLKTKGLTRHFGGLKAVNEVDFEIREGEIRALIGPNGAGKTTFVSLLSGRIAPSAGSIEFLGRDITKDPAHKRVRDGIAYTFQITSIYPGLTAFENVALSVQSAQRRAPKPAGLSARDLLHRKTRDALERVGLGERAGDLAGTMSYGHQRLLEVAMGLALEPRLLILDEPTQGLSDGEIENFCALVKEIARSATVLLIEHNMPVVMQLADSITVLDHGELLANGTPEEIRANKTVQAVYLGAD